MRQALLNLCARELEILDSFMDGIYALRDLVQEALNPPPVVIASFVILLYYCFTTVLLLLYHFFTTALPLLYCCFTTALLHRWSLRLL